MEFASSSSKPYPQFIHDVFINFWGEDMGRKFVSHLYYALSDAKVRTFLGDENLVKGMEHEEELMQAKVRSKIAIVVFTRSYAESSWCLDELEKIMACHDGYGLRVMPIFYEIDPSFVRDEKGGFGKALKAAAQKRYSGKDLEYTLARWSRALTQASHFIGWVESHQRNDAQLVEKIVNDVVSLLGNKVLSSTTEFLVGLESRIDKVIGFIENHQCTKACIIGIWGMRGSGKTIISKAIYDLGLSVNRSFIQISQTDTRGPHHLQKLLSDVLNKKIILQSIRMGITMIKNKLHGKRVLIVFDNVNDIGQLEDLCGNHDWFGQGNIIIITTRDLHLLNLLKVDYVYEMEELDENESLEFLSWRAFKEAKPKDEFNELARNVVAYCAGLPLALTVVGSVLQDKNVHEWKNALLGLEKVPHPELQQTLKMSFNNLLGHTIKDIFLDVCCFFVGKDKTYVTHILNGCGLLHVSTEIAVLVERSLIKVDENNKLQMHPLLKQMGREIIRESSIKDPRKQSRLWFHQDVLDLLATNTGMEAIEGLTLKSNLTNTYCFEANAFEKMKKLKYLKLDNVQLSGDYRYLSKNLRWICWRGFPLKFIPNNFNLDGVIVIDLKCSNLILVWKEPRVLQWLKILNLSHSKYLTKTPDFSGLPSLEKLILKGCSSLRRVHQSIGDLSNLLLINLKDCKSLSHLPKEIYKLKSLEMLNLTGCSKIDILEEDIAHMKSLITLISENTVVKQVPLSILSSKNIGYISLCKNEGLSHVVVPSIIQYWMSTTMKSSSCIGSNCGTSLVFMDMKKNFGDLAPIHTIISNLRSILLQYDMEFQLTKRVNTISDDVYGVEFTTLEISEHPAVRSYLIGIGSYQEVFNTLNHSISEGLATNEVGDFFLPGNNYPYWLAHIGGENSVYFTMPERCHLKGMTLCVVYSSTPEKIVTECLINILMVNHTKCTIQIYNQDTVTSFNDDDWHHIMSNLGSGDKIEIFVTFGHELVVKKIAVYLMYDELFDMGITTFAQAKPKCPH